MSGRGSLWAVHYHPLRAFFFLKGLYLLLACDLWFGMIQHGGRYGEGGFNVAHFELLDRLIPLPSPALYVGILIACGFLALQLGLGPAPRPLRLLLAAAYTFGWLLSIHDSYQHHYLLSLLLVWAAAYPDLSARQAASGELVSGWGFPMTAITCAIVYAFTGISKSESAWRNGDVLRALTRTRPPGDAHPGKFDRARDLLLSTGLDEHAIWQLFALSTIALQWTIAIAYVVSSRRDERPSPLRSAVVAAGLFAALAFHLMAELFHVFEIGLFSYYMMLIAILFFAPTRALAPLVNALAALHDRAAKQLSLPASAELWARSIRALLALLLLAAIGFTIPLPGAIGATFALAGLGLVRIFVAVRTRAAAQIEALGLSTAVASIALWLALTQSSVPFDYYRRTAGELQHMGQLERALSMYRMAELHAPKGRSRADKIREIEAKLAKRGSEREAVHAD